METVSELTEEVSDAENNDEKGVYVQDGDENVQIDIGTINNSVEADTNKIELNMNQISSSPMKIKDEGIELEMGEGSFLPPLS